MDLIFELTPYYSLNSKAKWYLIFFVINNFSECSFFKRARISFIILHTFCNYAKFGTLFFHYLLPFHHYMGVRIFCGNNIMYVKNKHISETIINNMHKQRKRSHRVPLINCPNKFYACTKLFPYNIYFSYFL